MKTVFIGSDHAGFQTKLSIIDFVKQKFPHLKVEDCGCNLPDRTDYTRYAKIVVQKVLENDGIGLLICGSGVGVSIAANKYSGIRAALVYNNKVAELSRQHNDANIACFGARMFADAEIIEMVEIFLTTNFLGGVYLERVQNIEI
jgi:ribose 5-phosphate isomerase B